MRRDGGTSFRVESRFRVDLVNGGLGGTRLIEERVDGPYIKDYDAEKGEGPSRWAKRWDLSNWGFLAAYDGDRRVGGAVIAFDTEGVDMLRGLKDMAVLWDLRVHPDFRGRGVGARLFEAAVEWSKHRGCCSLEVETQNINIPACRFYESRGCTLRSIDLDAYQECPGEVKLIWKLALTDRPGKSKDGLFIRQAAASAVAS